MSLYAKRAGRPLAPRRVLHPNFVEAVRLAHPPRQVVLMTLASDGHQYRRLFSGKQFPATPHKLDLLRRLAAMIGYEGALVTEPVR